MLQVRNASLCRAGRMLFRDVSLGVGPGDPLARRSGESRVAVYVSLGQAF